MKEEGFFAFFNDSERRFEILGPEQDENRLKQNTEQMTDAGLDVRYAPARPPFAEPAGYIRETGLYERMLDRFQLETGHELERD